MKALNQQLEEITEKYEYEAKRLKENIAQLEQRKPPLFLSDSYPCQELAQQKQHSKAREGRSKEDAENLALQTGKHLDFFSTSSEII